MEYKFLKMWINLLNNAKQDGDLEMIEKCENKIAYFSYLIGLKEQ